MHALLSCMSAFPYIAHGFRLDGLLTRAATIKLDATYTHYILKEGVLSQIVVGVMKRLHILAPAVHKPCLHAPAKKDTLHD